MIRGVFFGYCKNQSPTLRFFGIHKNLSAFMQRSRLVCVMGYSEGLAPVAFARRWLVGCAECWGVSSPPADVCDYEACC